MLINANEAHIISSKREKEQKEQMIPWLLKDIEKSIEFATNRGEFKIRYYLSSDNRRYYRPLKKELKKQKYRVSTINLIPYNVPIGYEGYEYSFNITW